MTKGILSFGRDDDDIVVVAFSETPILRNTGRSAYELAADVAEALFKQCGLEPGGIDGFSTVLPLSEAGNPFWANYCAEYLGIAPVWQNLAACGGASVLSGIAATAAALSDHRCEAALLVHADAPSTRDLSVFGAHRTEIADPTGLFGAPGTFGMIMTRYIAEYGLDRHGLANLLCTQRSNAASNELSYPKLRSAVTPDDYLRARVLSEPLTLLDSVMPCDGANGLILMRGETATRMGLRAVARLLSYGEITNPDIHDPRADMLRPGHARIAASVLEAAGVRREDLDLLCLYDDFLIAVALQLEAFGYCARGEGSQFLARTDISPAGKLPINPGGGLIGCGQTGLACGGQLFLEAVRQVAHQAEARQVPEARYALVTGIGVMPYGRSWGTSNCMVISNA